jgi:hypothetical protein
LSLQTGLDECSGYLQKQSGKGMWQKRFFRVRRGQIEHCFRFPVQSVSPLQLNNRFLVYYNAEGGAPAAAIDLADVRTVLLAFLTPLC